MINDRDIIIENIIPCPDDSLKVTLIIPKESLEIQKMAIEAFFESAARNISARLKGPKSIKKNERR